MTKETKDAVFDRIRQIQYAIEKIGFPFLVCVFLGFALWYVAIILGGKIDRTIRNTRAIMTFLKIPVIVGEEDWGKK